MDTGKLLKSINEICFKAMQGRLSEEDLQCNFEDGFGGNADDAFSGGLNEGRADLATQIVKELKKFTEE